MADNDDDVKSDDKRSDDKKSSSFVGRALSGFRGLLAGILIGLISGLISGIAVEQSNSYIARADVCYESLEYFTNAVNELPVYYDALIRPGEYAYEDSHMAGQRWNLEIRGSSSTVANKCPLDEAEPGYFAVEDVQTFNAWSYALFSCVSTTPCSDDDLISNVDGATAATEFLKEQANEVQRWGTRDRILHILTHLI